MKNLITNSKTKISIFGLLMLITISISSCDLDYDIAEANSIADKTPPTANFEAIKSNNDYLTYNFSNLSTSANTFEWNFGDGTSAITLDAVHTFPGEGSYTVVLNASDSLGVESTFSVVVEVVEPEVPVAILPTILAPGFDFGNVDESKDPWKNSALGGVIQISTSADFEGGFSSKYPSGTTGLRIAYQELTVTPNTNYLVTCKYSQDVNANNGSVRMAILGNAVTDPANLESSILTSSVGTNATGKANFTTVLLTFNSGASSTIALFVDNNGGTVSYVDSFTIALN